LRGQFDAIPEPGTLMLLAIAAPFISLAKWGKYTQ
jgi:hypothetical protein